jgi:SAM-dependent methyltransferase
MIKCRNCNFIYLNPRPSTQDLRAFYQQGYLPDDPESIENWRCMMKGVYRTAVGHIEKYCRKGKVLDIGCGFGFFLQELKQKSWEVTGLDMSLSGISYARETLKLPVHCAWFEETEFPENHFDVVAAFYVIEHAYNPVEFLKKIHRVLKPKGIVLLRYPHTYSLERLLTSIGIENNAYDIPFHLSDFSPPTIERFLIKTGFSDCRHFLGGFTLPEKFSHKMGSSIFGIVAEALYYVSNKTYLMPGVSKSVIAIKPS